MHWFFLFIAVIGNILANISFKKVMTDQTLNLEEKGFSSLISHVWIWLALCGCVALLLGYLFAIRSVGLATTYALVTTLSLVALSLFSFWMFGEKFSTIKILGVGMIVLGVLCVAYAEAVSR